MSEDYTDDELETIQAKVGGWIDEFTNSPQFARLTQIQKEEADAVISFFADHTYSYLGQTPEEWDRGAVIECCTDILPRKITAKRCFFEAVAPVLSEFFTFLADKSLLPSGHALAKTVAGLNRKILAASEAPQNWGMAKSFAMAAAEAGVELGDQRAMDRFMAEYNERLLAQQKSLPPLPPIASPVAAPLPAPTPVHRAGPKVGRNDPCPCSSGKKFKKCCGA